MYKFLLCVRYLRTRYIALASIMSVMLGVATMIVVNSVMAGFTAEMRSRLHNFLADIVIESRSMDGIADAERQMNTVREVAGQYIAAMTPTVEIPGMMTFSDPYSGESYTAPVQILGVDPQGKARVGPLQDYLDSYNEVIENDVVIRPPLRPRDEPLGWDLTPSAMEYRRFRKEQDALYLQDSLRDDLDNAPGNSPVPEAVAPEAGGSPLAEAPEFDVASDDGLSTSAATTAGDTVTADASTAPSQANEPPSSDLMLPDDPNFPDMLGGNDRSKVRTDPLPARIYLGEGIVSFQAVDPKTNEKHKVSMVEPGDDVILSTVTAGRPPEITKFPATVVDMFRSGMSEHDTSVVLMNIDELQKNRGMHLENAITAIHVRLNNYDDAAAAVKAITMAFPPGMVTIKTWEEKQGLLLSAVEVETAILNVLLFLIITVAGFGILAIFFMIVVEKTRDIGILKSLGASSGGVMSIFLSYGLALGIVGSTAGVMIGLLFVRYINQIEDVLSWLTGRKVFDEKIYYFPEIPTSVNPLMVLGVAAGAISIAVLASILPARRAARLHPVRALRFE
jgi:lipoprotein-releasing system permease protein